MVDREAQIQKKIDALYAELEALRRNSFWSCTFCKKKTKIGTLEVISWLTYHIEDWILMDLYSITCPKCNKESSGYGDKGAWKKVKDNLHYFKRLNTKERRYKPLW